MLLQKGRKGSRSVHRQRYNPDPDGGQDAGRELVGIEIQKPAADLARRSVAANGLGDRVNIICADIKEAQNYLSAGIFDVVTCNPPYMISEHGIRNPDSPRAIARHEIMCTFDDVAAVAAKMLRPGGRFSSYTDRSD